jgi:type IV secretion system protein VirB10
MAGLAAVIVLVILVAGHPQPLAPSSGTPRPAGTKLADGDRIRAYQQQLAEDEVRLRQVQKEAMRTTAPAGTGGRSASRRPGQSDPVRDEARRLDHLSLFADNVAFTRRPTGQQSVRESGARGTTDVGVPPSFPSESQALVQALTQPTARAAVQTPETSSRLVTEPASTSVGQPGSGAALARDEYPAAGDRLRLLEGTVIETVLLNRLDGTFAGPVTCLVTTPVYSQDRQSVLIPAGARALGAAAPVQSWGDARLAVSFHRLVMPDGHSYSLDRFKGLDQIGETGLKDEVNRHYWQVFGASLAVGALSGLAQFNTRGFDANTFGDTYRQAAGASLSSASTRVLDRYLNVLPTITIREGFRIKVYLTNDLALPAYEARGAGGGR